MSRFTNLTLTELLADQSAIEAAIEAKRREAPDWLIEIAKARANVLNASSAWGSEDGALINALIARIEGVTNA
jgi:hypothetical protein